MKSLIKSLLFVIILMPISSFSDSIVEGKKLTFDRKKGNCLACHMIEDGELAGNNGPPLLAMKARFPDRDVLFQQIWDPKRLKIDPKIDSKIKCVLVSIVFDFGRFGEASWGRNGSKNRCKNASKKRCKFRCVLDASWVGVPKGAPRWRVPGRPLLHY